ncbi:unnamed protein product [Peronospora belbahrii]|uniref:Rap-GAP domain-containing protein n=1 Tax=Peronospora belbahrii TaxID=622444 RepID=A0AAU9KXD2_9STRA|nr:unnamed protein product [Peronospora belbahrii]
MEDTTRASDTDQVDALTAAIDVTTSSHDLPTVNTTQTEVFHSLTSDETLSLPQQQPNCDASETPSLAATPFRASLEPSRSPDLQRSLSSSNAAYSRSVSFGVSRRNRSRSGGDDASSELVLQLQRLCKRQRQRSEERSFVRDVERVLSLLRVQSLTSVDSGVTSATFPGPGMRLEMLGSVQEEHVTDTENRSRSSATNKCALSGMSSSDGLHVSRVTLTLSEIDALLDCIADLFDHRNAGVRALAFEVVELCLLRFGERLTPDLRRKIFLRLETHPPGDFLLRQTALRALTQDGQHLEPFQVELGWFLLRLLEHSDAQRDLFGLIQSILHRSPRALDRDKVIAIISVISTRCCMAWSRGDFDACHSFVAFFHTLASHNSAYAASTTACLRALCCLVNADGHETWSIMKLLLNGSSGFLVLRGLVQVLEHPTGADSPWRVAKFDDIAWAPILLALERALQCCRGVVIFEVILSIQRLIKKYGATHQPASDGQSAASSSTVPVKTALHSGDSSHDASETSSSSNSCTSGYRDKRCLVMEWDIILRMLRALRPWVSMTDEKEMENFPQQSLHPDDRRPEADVNRHTSVHSNNDLFDQSEHHLSVSIQQTRIPRELLDTLQTVEDLVEQHRFAGDVEEFLNILEDYLPHLSENSMLFLLRQRAEAAHPGYHISWLATLTSAMRTFFSGVGYDGDSFLVPRTVRLEALKALRANLWTSRNVCEDRVIEEVVIPTLGRVYEDPDADVRCRALEFIIEVMRQLESVKFDSLLDILASAMTLSINEDAQLVAASGIASLFSSAFDHLPPARAVRMYDLFATTVEAHRSRAVRHIALSCLLYVCAAHANDGRLQWKQQQQVRTSRFLFVSRRAARVNASGIQLTAACVPVARALRSLLTLISAEPDAELFRMAVKGIKTMLGNRAILEDVDVSEVSAKVVASIDYRAFGRAAVADEVDRLLNERTNERKSSVDDEMDRRDQKAHLDCRGTVHLVSQTDAELVRLIHASTRPDSTGGSKVSLCASVRSTTVLLARRRFLDMGIELLQLLVSYESELHDNALQELTRCLVGAMKLRLAVAEKDLFTGGSAADDSTSSSSTPNMFYRQAETESQLDVTDPYASGAPLCFTSRVLSRFHTSTSHGKLFHALSGSMSKSALGSSSSANIHIPLCRPTREDRARLQGFLRQLFDSEFKLLHTTTTALSLLALLAPASVLGQLDQVLQNLRGCVTTIDGDFRSDAFVAMLELLGTITPLLCAKEDKGHSAHKAIIEALLLGFEYAKSKQLAYLAFRLLCQVIYQSNLKERVCLAALAMPTLQQCTHRANSLLVEAAVDFLMCYAYSQSALAPSALCTRQESESKTISMDDDSRQTRSRSWVYKRSLMTITTNLRGDASLTIRRANCTSKWKLVTCHRPPRSSHFPLDMRRESDNILTNSDRPRERPMEIIGARNAVAPKRPALPAELRPSYPSQSRTCHGNDSQMLASSEDKAACSSHNDRAINSYTKAMQNEDRGVVDSTMQNTSYQQPATATVLAPLPAYDGIGGSPSYYCENAQVCRKTQRNMRLLTPTNKRGHSRQAGGDDGHEVLSGKPVIRAIREDVEEYDDTENQQGVVENEQCGSEMDAFSLDNSFSNAPSMPAETPRILQFANSSFPTTLEAAAVGSMHGLSTCLDDDQYDPKYLMTQLFDLTVENRPQLLSEGPALKLALSVLDRTPAYETHKIGLLYVRDEKQSSETTILGNTGGSLRYLQFLRRLGTFTKLEGLPGYTGGLDTVNNSDGKFGLIYKDSCAQIVFHVATMMVPGSTRSDNNLAPDTFASMKKKRHIGNDFVHVVFKECDEDYDIQTLSGQFNDVHIIIQPLNDHEYRTEVHVKQGIPPFGPLYGKQIVPSSIVSESVRITCLNANLACQVFHQDLVGFGLNCEERLKQIKQLGLRLVNSDEWKT